jgi:cyclopropane fatty-acyl-phospholipid synthase-like methyltransferase
MKTIEESVVIAMDGSDKELFPFLPYILQDVWEIGADPNSIIRLIKMHCKNIAKLKVLDLGCGKGAVSVKVSIELGCACYGIDAIHEFIEFANQKATEFKVNHLCKFETGDIRKKVQELSNYDVVILGAIGPVFGDYYSTFTSLSKCINKNGIFIIDDGYIDDDSDFIHPLMYKKFDILQQIEMAGMQLVENDIMDKEYIKDSDDYIFENIKRRCNELINHYPDKQNLFLNYISNQEIENDVLENKVTGTTMVIKEIEK